MSTRLWIVIVTYRTPELVSDCLRSLPMQVGDLSDGWESLGNRNTLPERFLADGVYCVRKIIEAAGQAKFLVQSLIDTRVSLVEYKRAIR